MQSNVICQAIFSEIQSIVGIHFKQVVRVKLFYHLYDWPNSSDVGITYKLVRWETKESGRFTLNMDRCSNGNPGVGRGGGVLRDSNGLPLIGFSGENTGFHP